MGAWIGCVPEDVLVFGPEYRPVPLETHVLSAGDERDNYFLFERRLKFQVANVIQRHASGRPTLGM